jgi:hypothetical protein
MVPGDMSPYRGGAAQLDRTLRPDMSGPLERYANEDLQLSRWSGQEFLPGWEFVAAERAVTFAVTNAIRCSRRGRRGSLPGRSRSRPPEQRSRHFHRSSTYSRGERAPTPAVPRRGRRQGVTVLGGRSLVCSHRLVERRVVRCQPGHNRWMQQQLIEVWAVQT